MEKLAEESSCMTSVAFVKVVKNLSHAYLKCMKDTRYYNSRVGCFSSTQYTVYVI